MTLIDRVLEAGFPFGARSVIHLFEGGSALHGARLQGKSDLDIYGLFIEPPKVALGMDRFEHFVTSTSGNENRNTAEDSDVTLYSLRRWAFLAAKGNPTALNFLFADNALDNRFSSLNKGKMWWKHNSQLRSALLCKLAARQFRGFVDGQMGRLLGTKGVGKHGQRPELVDNFGYDTKAGMHAIRLLGEGIELMRTGRITFPRPNAEDLIAVRQGSMSLDKLCAFVGYLCTELDDAVAQSLLPQSVDRDVVNDILTRMYLEHWMGH